MQEVKFQMVTWFFLVFCRRPPISEPCFSLWVFGRVAHHGCLSYPQGLPSFRGRLRRPSRRCPQDRPDTAALAGPPRPEAKGPAKPPPWHPALRALAGPVTLTRVDVPHPRALLCGGWPPSPGFPALFVVVPAAFPASGPTGQWVGVPGFLYFRGGRVASNLKLNESECQILTFSQIFFSNAHLSRPFTPVQFVSFWSLN